MLEREGADLIITDFNMPNLDGIGPVKAVKARNEYRFTPIVMLTARADEADGFQAISTVLPMRSALKSSGPDLTSTIRMSPFGPRAIRSALRPLGRVTSARGA